MTYPEEECGCGLPGCGYCHSNADSANNLHKCVKQHGSVFLLPVDAEFCSINLLYEKHFQDSPLVVGRFYIPKVVITSVCLETGACDDFEIHVFEAEL